MARVRVEPRVATRERRVDAGAERVDGRAQRRVVEEGDERRAAGDGAVRLRRAAGEVRLVDVGRLRGLGDDRGRGRPRGLGDGGGVAARQAEGDALRVEDELVRRLRVERQCQRFSSPARARELVAPEDAVEGLVVRRRLALSIYDDRVIGWSIRGRREYVVG